MHFMHYIGGRYSRPSFIREARKQGVSRRVSVSHAKTMNFGDTVVLAVWNSGSPTAFAEFQIQHITLSSDVAEAVGQQLAEEGRATSSGNGPVSIVRQCGYYCIVGSWTVDAEFGEIVELAEVAAKEKGTKPWYMISGPLTRVYAEPKPLPMHTKFFRGFKRLEAGLGNVPPISDKGIIGIAGYTRH